MNYLAHLYLANPDPVSWIGNLMGDFVKGTVPEALEPGLQRGILLHRKIDAFTDAHEIFCRSKGRIRPEFRRYAGILLDLYYDHFLARHWATYSSVPLTDFSQSVYGVLKMHYSTLPATMQRSVSYMIANDLLLSYQRVEGVERALYGIEKRLRRKSCLGEAVTDLKQNYTALEMDFGTFFPELIVYAEQEKARLDRIGKA